MYIHRYMYTKKEKRIWRRGLLDMYKNNINTSNNESSILSGFYNRKGFIVSQHPLDNTVSALWQLVSEQDIRLGCYRCYFIAKDFTYRVFRKNCVFHFHYFATWALGCYWLYRNWPTRQANRSDCTLALRWVLWKSLAAICRRGMGCRW